MPVMAIDVESKAYICPGERHPISRSVHLSRLAAAFPACRECPLRDDAPRIAVRVVPLVEIDTPAAASEGLITAGGLRGVFLNAITPRLAERVATSFARSLWEKATVHGPNDGIDRGARLSRPTVVVGYDERPSSPTIFAAAVAGLRRMGCHLFDVGLLTKPAFWFAVDHLHASGGLFVTGSGAEPSWTGLDFLWEHARPASTSEIGNLQSAADGSRNLQSRSAARPTRTAGTERTFQATTTYESSLAKHFEGIRACRVVCTSSSPIVLQSVQRLFKGLSCELLSSELSVKTRNPARRRDEGILRLSTKVRESQAQLGIMIDDDGQRCGFVDERGRHVSSAAIARLIAPLLIAESPGATVVVESAALVELRPLIEAMGAQCHGCAGDLASMSAAVADSRAVYGGGDSGRHWFFESYANCDAMLILARVLRALSHANQPFSQLAAS
jgi:phosphomannomutase